MSKLFIIKPKVISEQLKKMIDVFVSTSASTTTDAGDANNTSATGSIYIDNCTNIPELEGGTLLFALELNEAGFCSDVLMIMEELYKRGNSVLKNTRGAVLVHSKSDLYTKSSANYIVFLANNLGCAFIGHPLVEATASLSNFTTWQKTMPISLEEICIEQCKKLANRLFGEILVKYKKPKILALHASSRKTSNTLVLWSMIKENLQGCDIEELNVENGTVHDCIGCPFTTCIHYSEQNSCFYGGQMVKEIIPAIEKADALVMICPNYNDAVSANLTAVINRTTALYRKMSFHEKYIFSVVVSGNSGGDSVARQLIDALNLNKGFALAPYSSIFATANDPDSIKLIPDIELKAKHYADSIIDNIKK